MSKKDETKKPKTDDYINTLEKLFEEDLFINKDMRVSAFIGLLFKLTSYQQETKLKTRSLIKDSRTLLKKVDRENLIKIINNCNEIIFALAAKKDTTLSLEKVRSKCNEYLVFDKWDSKPEERALAFMIGYDTWRLTYRKFGSIEEDEVEEEGEETE